MHVHKDLKKVKTGIYERPGVDPGRLDPWETVKALDRDKYNYQCIGKRLKEIMTTEFYSVASLGGPPILASMMNAAEVAVYGPDAMTLKKLHRQFLEHYPSNANFQYAKKQLTHPNFTPNAEVAVIVGVLETLTAKEGERLLKNLEVRKVLVSAPNLERAKSDRWGPYRNPVNSTFCTIEAMGRMLEKAGYKVTAQVTHCEHYLIFAEK